MNRKSITGIILAISLLLNVILFVFGFVQKAAADSAREVAMENERHCSEQSRLAKAQLDLCEGLREQSDRTREECEQRVLTLSNRK
jgi:hypothetical protein